MADVMTPFSGPEAVSRENFNNRIEQANAGFEAAVKDAAVKDAPADGDSVVIIDSTDGNKTKRALWGKLAAAFGALYVPLARKINGKALSADVTLAAGDVGAVPTGRKINGKALTADIALTAGDVGAATSTQGTKADAALARSGGTMTGKLTAASTAVGDSAVRNSYAGTAAMTPGSTNLATGVVYYQYE